MAGIRAKAFGLAVLAALAGAAPVASQDGAALTDGQERLVAACESVLSRRLKAPSTYKRIAVYPVECRRATLEEFLGWETEEQRLRAELRAGRDTQAAALQRAMKDDFYRQAHFRYSALVEYDAMNAFGVPLRGAFECSDVGPACDWEPSKFRGPAVDKMRQTDWALQGLSIEPPKPSIANNPDLSVSAPEVPEPPGKVKLWLPGQ